MGIHHVKSGCCLQVCIQWAQRKLISKSGILTDSFVFMFCLQVNNDMEPMAVLIHPEVEYRMNLTGILKGERWSVHLSDPTSSQYYTLSQHFSEKVTCKLAHKHIHSYSCTLYTTLLHMHISVSMWCLQVSAALDKLNEFKSISVLDFRQVLDFFKERFCRKSCMNFYLWR